MLGTSVVFNGPHCFLWRQGNPRSGNRLRGYLTDSPRPARAQDVRRMSVSRSDTPGINPNSWGDRTLSPTPIGAGHGEFAGGRRAAVIEESTGDGWTVLPVGVPFSGPESRPGRPCAAPGTADRELQRGRSHAVSSKTLGALSSCWRNCQATELLVITAPRMRSFWPSTPAGRCLTRASSLVCRDSVSFLAPYRNWELRCVGREDAGVLAPVPLGVGTCGVGVAQGHAALRVLAQGALQADDEVLAAYCFALPLVV